MPPLNYSTGPKYPTTTPTTNGTGSDSQWANPANIFADDGSNATSAFFNTIFQTQDLIGRGFAFDIPTNAVIDGIVAQIEVPSSNRWAESNGSVRLQKAGSSVGDNKAGTGSSLSNVWTYGGDDDLWGTTWTPAEINAANFGLAFSATFTSSPNDFSIAIDFFRVTVYWHYDFDVPPADVPKRHVYKVYDNAGTYLGNIPKVITPFQFSEDIETAGVSLGIDVGLTPDITRNRSKRLTTELGEWITDEAGRYIVTDGGIMPFTIGTDDNNNSLLKNGNRVVVMEYCYYYPNGKAMYSGQIQRINARFGGNNPVISLQLMSDGGIELDNYITRGVPPSLTEQQAQATTNSNFTVSQDGDKGAGWNRCGQTIAVVGTNIAAITLRLNGTARVTVSLYDAPNGSLLTSTSQNVVAAAADVQFVFSEFTEGLTTAFAAVSVDPGQSIQVGINTAGGYSSGDMYSSNYSGGSGGGSYGVVTGQDLYFKAYSGVLNTQAVFSSVDPTTGMFLPIMDDYTSQGGRITAADADVDATGLTLSYTFSVQTVLEAIKAIRDMSPSDFYWRIDVGTNEMEFKEISATPDYMLIKTIHINELQLTLSIENVKNKVLFSGGDTGGGQNLYKQYIDSDSINLYGPRLNRKSDNRVTVATTADAVGESMIDEFGNEKQQTTVTIPASVMDISLLTPGKVVGFGNFGNFIDQMQLLIVRRDYTPGMVTLTLGMLPKNLPTVVEQMQRSLIAEQTVANPSAPS
jgi:hypothetical protein